MLSTSPRQASETIELDARQPAVDEVAEEGRPAGL